MNSRVGHVYQGCKSTVRSCSARVTFSNARVNEDWRKLATCTKEVYYKLKGRTVVRSANTEVVTSVTVFRLILWT